MSIFPTIDHLLTQLCDVHRRTEVVEPDGDISTTETVELAIRCYVERITITEMREGEQVDIATWRAFFDAGFIADDSDFIVIDGLSLEFVGPAQPVFNPRGSYIHHVEGRMREVT